MNACILGILCGCRVGFAITLLTISAVTTTAEEWNLSLAGEARELLEKNDHFAAALLQDGVLRPVANDSIVLRLASFSIVLITHEPNGVLMNASVRPTFYDGVRDGLALDRILEDPGMFMGMAEPLFNRERSLYVSEVYPHYLFYTDHLAHRFDFVHIAAGTADDGTGSAVIGVREVEFLWDIDGSAWPEREIVPVDALATPLYLSFFATIFEKNERVELQRLSAELLFR